VSYFSIVQLNKDRCWICNYRKETELEVRLLPYLCFWCSSRKSDEVDRITIRSLIENITTEVEEHLKQGRLAVCEDIDALSFAADIGDLGTQHLYLKQFSSMIGLITVQVALEGRYTPSRLLKVAAGSGPAKWFRVRECIRFLTDVGLLEQGEGKYIYERFRPTNLFLALTASVEAVSKVEEELPPRIARCVAGYALLRGIGISIDWLQRGAQGEPKGVIRLYPRDKHGRLWIPRLFTAPTMFLLGYLAHGHNEFSANEIRSWLHRRGIQREKDVAWIVNWLARTVPADHRLVDPSYDGYSYHFKFNRLYIRMRERYRERRRGGRA